MQSTEPKPSPIFVPGVTNIKPLIELLNPIEGKGHLITGHQGPSGGVEV
jgi:hypothetical protein